MKNKNIIIQRKAVKIMSVKDGTLCVTTTLEENEQAQLEELVEYLKKKRGTKRISKSEALREALSYRVKEIRRRSKER